MRIVRRTAVLVGTTLAVRLVRSRHRRSLHPAGRSFAGRVRVDGIGEHAAVVRISKGAGTRGARPDVRGLAVRVLLPGRPFDLLLSTAGRGRLGRHMPMPRRTFDATYGSIMAYRNGAGEKVYVAARPDGPAVGRALEEISEGARFALCFRDRAGERPAGWVSLDRTLTPAIDAALAFDPVRNSLPEFHPTGLVHGLRAYAYRLSQRWRGVTGTHRFV